MVKWVVMLSLMSPEGTLVKTHDVNAYQTREACEAVKPIRLMRVMDILTKYNMKIVDVSCGPEQSSGGWQE